MKPRALEFLVCPIDKTQLELVEWEVTYSSLSSEEIKRIERLGLDLTPFSREIVTGVLLNRTRKIFYPIYKGVPRLLTFRTGIANHFVKDYAERIDRELPGFTTPHQAATQGEETVLRTFSSEWVNYDWDGRSYWNLNAVELYDCMHFLLDLSRRPVKDRLVLEVGIGIGGIADYMARKEECELIGIDLGYAVDPAYKHFGKNAFLHIVQSSVFALPFRESTFDLAYSQGVIHHTFSTKTAFDRLCKLPKRGGRLYIWVYNPASEERTLIRRIIMLMERVMRPICWRLPERFQTVALLPIIPLYLIHQNLYARRSNKGSIKYGWREALHAARDRFTPRFAHRHTEEEVCGWFRDAGYAELQCASKREQRAFPGISILANETAVDGVRT